MEARERWDRREAERQAEEAAAKDAQMLAERERQRAAELEEKARSRAVDRLFARYMPGLLTTGLVPVDSEREERPKAVRESQLQEQQTE